MFKPAKLLLIILPIILVALSFYQKSELTNYHMYVSDPEYSYLFSGMNLCNWSTPDHVQDRYPSQVLSAVVIKIVYTFRSTTDTLNVDVMKNPDVYCSAINTATFILLALSLLIAGWVVSFASKNIVTGLLFQFIPFTKWVLLDLNSRIMVESFIILGVILLMAMVMLYVYDDKVDHKKWIDKYIIGFSLLIGFIASTKLVYLPIAILPFVLLSGTKRRIIYVISSMLAFFIISFPILFHWVTFRDWYIMNFFHSGMYGSGKAAIIDWGSFINNFKGMFVNNGFYLITFIALLIFPFLYFLPLLKLKKVSDKEFKAFMGIILTVIILTFLVSKQYKEYYLTVNYLLVVPAWYFIIKIISRRSRAISFKYIQLSALIIIAFFVWREGPKLVLNYHQIHLDRDAKFRESLTYVENNYNSSMPVVVLADYYGAPFKEYGDFFGIAWCGPKMANIYAKDLKILYPNIYFFHGWNNSFNNWGTSHSFIDLLKEYGSVTFFSGDKVWEKKLQDKLHGINRQVDTQWKVTKTFDKIGQRFYEVKYNSSGDSIKQYACDAEITDSINDVFVNGYGQLFGGASYQNAEVAKSGNHSVKLTKDQYGFTCSLSEVQKGEHYLIEAWRYKNDTNNSALVVQSVNENEFYLSTSISTYCEKDWEKLSLDFVVPENLHNKDVKIYCWNFDEVNPVYFDDLVIKKLIDK